MIKRLRGREEFGRLRRQGTRSRSGVVWCVMVSDPSLDGSYVAYAIGRTAGLAVKRNRVRRQLRSLLGDHSSQLQPGLYLIGLTRSARSISFSELKDSLADLIPKLVTRCL